MTSTRRVTTAAGSLLLVLISVVLVSRLVPLLESPFALGAAVAVVYWLARKYRPANGE